MAARKHLIIGCGSAALAAAEKIRAWAPDDEIKLVTKESYLPYSPTALPYLLSGRVDETRLWMRREEFFSRLKIALGREKEVVRIVPAEKVVFYRDGEKESYDQLLIATGSEPVYPSLPGLDKAGLFGFHTLDDYQKIRQLMSEKREVAIYGGGLVGMELAMGLLEKGYQPKVIVRSRVLRTYFDAEAGAIIEGIYKKNGALLYPGTELAEILANGGGKARMICRDGQCLTADLLVLCLGVKARTSFLEGSGIIVQKGILADRKMQTSVPGIYVAGDAAEAPDFFMGENGVNPILPNAVEQGKVAGLNMVGQDVEYQGWIPVNILHFFGNFAFSAGMATQANGEGFLVMKEKKEEAAQFKKLVFQGDKLAGAIFINHPVTPALFYQLIKRKVKVGAYQEQLFAMPEEVSRWLLQENERKKTFLAH